MIKALWLRVLTSLIEKAFLSWIDKGSQWAALARLMAVKAALV